METIGVILLIIWFDLTFGKYITAFGQSVIQVREQIKADEAKKEQERAAAIKARKEWESSHLHILAQQLYEEMQRKAGA